MPGSDAMKETAEIAAPRVLLVEDDTVFAERLRKMAGEDFDIVRVSNVGDALLRLEFQQFDLVLLDLDLGPDSPDGLAFLEKLPAGRPHPPVVLVTVERDALKIRAAWKRQIADYIPKDIGYRRIVEEIRRLVEPLQLRRRVERLEKELLEEKHPFLALDHPLMKKVLAEVERAASLPSTVLLVGETGTGKTTVAMHIHRRSPRANGPFRRLDCAATQASVLAPELFGRIPGAYTGADRKAGIAEEANGGTLFLDNVDQLPRDAHGYLLDLTDRGIVRRVGDTVERSVDVRLIAATKKDLASLAAAGRFTEDLAARLQVFTIRMPPLREMRETIPQLVEFYLEHLSHRLGIKTPKISPEALALLQAAPWPRNIRQLRNCLESCLGRLEGDIIRPQDLPEEIQEIQPTGGARPARRSLPELVQEAADRERKRLILDAMRRHAGNRRAAAEELGITTAAIGFWLRQYAREATEETCG
jgi:DNA-binding NtrC family response regulator